MKKYTMTLLLVMGLLIAACSAGGTPEAGPATQEMEPAGQGTGEAEAPAETVEISAEDLTGTTWAWTGFTNPVEGYTIEQPADYTLTFNDDGTVIVKADCNNAMGSYTADSSSLTIELGPMTMAACLPESRSDAFVNYLGSAAIYFFDEGELFIDLMADGGTMAFTSVDAVSTKETGSGSLPAGLVAQLDAYLESQIYGEGGYPEGAAPGMVLLVDTPEGRYLKAAGVASLEDGTPMTVDDHLEIGSNTKSMTVVILLQLEEQGRLSMDDMLSDWLPEQAAAIPNGELVNLRQLANMTTGFWDYGASIIGDAATDPDKLEVGYTPEELIAYAVENGTPQEYAPGEGYNYSNTNYILMGMIAEKITGKTLGELFQERIFDPLGMESAVLIEGVPQEGEITTQGYYWGPEGTRRNVTNWNVSQGWAAGAAAMTAQDLLTYGKALAAGELFQDLATLDQMLVFNDASMFYVAAPYGVGLIDFGEGYWGHEGTTPGFQSLWYTHPDKGYTVVGLSNSGTYSAYNFLNVRHILEGRGMQPFQGFGLMPLATQYPSGIPANWYWESSEAEGNQRPKLVLYVDSKAEVTGEGCGTAAGSFTASPEGKLSLDLDTTEFTCSGDEPAARLLALLEQADQWTFENGGMLLTLEDGTELRFAPR